MIVNYKARDHVLACVRSLRAAGVEHIVVADNASGDGVEGALAGADPGVTVVATGANLGYGGGANRGAAATTSDLLLVMNADVVVEPGAVKALVAALDHDPTLGVVGPRIEQPDGTLYPSARRFPSLPDALGHAFLGLVAPGNRFTRRYRMLDWDHAAADTVDWVSGSCFLVRRGLWNRLGGFDEGYFMFAEDVDLCWRAWRAGARVGYEPSGRVIHVKGVSVGQHPYRMIVEHHRALFRFARRSTSGPARALLPLVAAGLVARTAVSWTHHAVAARRRSASPGVL